MRDVTQKHVCTSYLVGLYTKILARAFTYDPTVCTQTKKALRLVRALATIIIIRLFAYCKGGNFNIHFWRGSAISSATEGKSDLVKS